MGKLEEKMEEITRYTEKLLFTDEITTESSIGKELLEIIKDEQYKYPKVRFVYFDTNKKITMVLEIKDTSDNFLLSKTAIQEYDDSFSEELKQELIKDMQDLLFKEVGKQFLEMAMERE